MSEKCLLICCLKVFCVHPMYTCWHILHVAWYTRQQAQHSPWKVHQLFTFGLLKQLQGLLLKSMDSTSSFNLANRLPGKHSWRYSVAVYDFSPFCTPGTNLLYIHHTSHITPNCFSIINLVVYGVRQYLLYDWYLLFSALYNEYHHTAKKVQLHHITQVKSCI